MLVLVAALAADNAGKTMCGLKTSQLAAYLSWLELATTDIDPIEHLRGRREPVYIEVHSDTGYLFAPCLGLPTWVTFSP